MDKTLTFSILENIIKFRKLLPKFMSEFKHFSRQQASTFMKEKPKAFFSLFFWEVPVLFIRPGPLSHARLNQDVCRGDVPAFVCLYPCQHSESY